MDDVRDAGERRAPTAARRCGTQRGAGPAGRDRCCCRPSPRPAWRRSPPPRRSRARPCTATSDRAPSSSRPPAGARQSAPTPTRPTHCARAGELAGGPTPLDVTEVLNKVPPHLLGDQIVSEARRLAGVTSVALYLIELEGTHLVRLAGSEEFPETLDVPSRRRPRAAPRGPAGAARADRARAPGQRPRPALPAWPRARASCSPSTPPNRRWSRSRARPPPHWPWPAPTPTSSTSRAGARRPARPPRSSRTSSRPASRASPARCWPATCCPATRSAATGSTTSRTATARGSASPTAWATARPPPRSEPSRSAPSAPSAR